MNLELLGRLPIDSNIAELADQGAFENFNNDYLQAAVDQIEKDILKGGDFFE